MSAKIDRAHIAKEWVDAEADLERLEIQMAEALARRDCARRALLQIADKLCGVELTQREYQILEGIRDNLQNKEIAAKLFISERTVKFHVSSLLAKAGVASRHELVERKVVERK